MAPPAEKSERVPEIPLTPSLDAWRAMSATARKGFVEQVNTILSSPPHFMGESVPHHKAKRRATDRLRKHFDAIGRVIYLAEELSVFYPNERAFTPDILAVRDVAESEDDERSAWIVADENRGIDLAIEIVFEGDRTKDLVHNVERYARLGIPEYFIYDRKKQDLIGYRLPSSEAHRYQRIIPQGGRHASAVLGLDLAIVNGKLEFFYGMSEIFGSEDLITRLQTMMGSLEAKAEQAKSEAERAKTDAEQAKTDAEQAILALQEGVLAIAKARGLVCLEAEADSVCACSDPIVLKRWLLRAATANSMADVLVEERKTD